MKKPRLLILVTLHLAVRYLVQTGLLEQISRFAQPVILLAWEDADLWRALIDSGCEVHLLPKNIYGARYQAIRYKTDIWHSYYRVQSVSTRIDRRRNELGKSLKQLFIKRYRLWKSLAELSLPGAVDRMLRAERQLLLSDTNIAVSQNLLAQLEPDALLSLTPFHREEDLFLSAAALRQIPLCTSILSFDNLTTRGWMPVQFDRYWVWNHYNHAEVLRIYPQVLPEHVEIVGPVQFDLYKNPRYGWSETKWRQKVNLPEDRPVILYASGIDGIIAHEDTILMDVDRAITAGQIPQNPMILLRLHPVDSRERWQPLLSRTKNLVLDDNFNLATVPDKNKYRGIVKYVRYTDEDIARQVSTLKYTQAHISVSSTMAIDGAIFDKPQITPAYNGLAQHARCLQELYQREHYLPITQSGAIEIVYNREQTVTAIANALVNPQQNAAQRRKMLEDVCTFTDGQCAQRLSNALQRFLGEKI